MEVWLFEEICCCVGLVPVGKYIRESVLLYIPTSFFYLSLKSNFFSFMCNVKSKLCTRQNGIQKRLAYGKMGRGKRWRSWTILVAKSKKWSLFSFFFLHSCQLVLIIHYSLQYGILTCYFICLLLIYW